MEGLLWRDRGWLRIGVSPDGSQAFVTGTSRSSGDSEDFATIAYSAADGSQLWASRFAAGADNFAADLVVGPHGLRVYVAGTGSPHLNVLDGYRLVSYDANTGDQARVAQYADGRYAGLNKHPDSARQVAVSPNGSLLFVTGDTDSGCTGSDVATLAYTP